VIGSQLVEARAIETVDKTLIFGVDFLVDGQSAMRRNADLHQLAVDGML
jgi:hypothetical protein